MVGVALAAAPQVGASAATSSSPTQGIIANGYSSINAIRSFFFCETTSCKKTKSSASSTAAVAMNYLEGEASALKPSSAPVAQRPVLKKFIADVKSLAKVYSVYSSETTSDEIAQNTGLIYYDSANVGSDIYVLTSLVKTTALLFGDWDVGAVAVLYTMQVDTQVLGAKTSSAANDIAANNDLEQDAKALKADANGPNAHFNALLRSFAASQRSVSVLENDVLEHKKSPVSTSTLKSDISKLAAQFTTIVNLQKTLAK
jgi:hypothetical protein